MTTTQRARTAGHPAYDTGALPVPVSGAFFPAVRPSLDGGLVRPTATADCHRRTTR